MKSIGIITSKELAELLDYDRDIISMLSEKEIKAEAIVWDEPHKPWESFDMLLMRTAWGYHLKHEDFRKMLDYFAENNLKVWNPPSIMLENMHKYYLKTLAEEGFDVIPTLFFESDGLNNIDEIAGNTGWNKFVIKPAISGGAFDTYVISDINQFKNGKGIIDKFKGRQFLLQKYLTEIETDGEWSVIFFCNGFCYSILKVPKKGDYRVQDDFGGMYYQLQAPEFVFESAKKIADYYIDKCLYIRVDGVVSDNKFYVMEVEMIEPHLFMDFVPEAKEPFVEAIIQKLNSNH